MQQQQDAYAAEQCLRAGRRGRSSHLWTCRQSFGHYSGLVGRVAVADCTEAQMAELGLNKDLAAELLASKDLQVR